MVGDNGLVAFLGNEEDEDGGVEDEEGTEGLLDM
jgi:hypothetical protein